MINLRNDYICWIIIDNNSIIKGNTVINVYDKIKSSANVHKAIGGDYDIYI